MITFGELDRGTGGGVDTDVLAVGRGEKRRGSIEVLTSSVEVASKSMDQGEPVVERTGRRPFVLRRPP